MNYADAARLIHNTPKDQLGHLFPQDLGYYHAEKTCTLYGTVPVCRDEAIIDHAIRVYGPGADLIAQELKRGSAAPADPHPQS